VAHLRALPSPATIPPTFRTGPMVVTDPILLCLDCGETFEWSASSDDDRCPWCADNRTGYFGTSA
jgi:hypothetical protein